MMIRFAVASLLILSATPSWCAEPKPAWFQRALVGLEVGPTGAQFGNSDANDKRYCAQWDGRQIVQRTVAARGEYLVLWVRDGDYAYYDSAILPKAPGLKGRDPLREAVDEARKHHLPLISYCVVQQAGHFLRAHPEWQMRGPDGHSLGRFCFNSGYLEAMKQIVAEQLAYGIDGFHIDMLDQGFGPPYGCWCEACQHKFEHTYGHSMPAAASWDEAWDKMLEFRYASSEQFERELTSFIKSRNPTTTVDYNYHGNPPFSFEVGQRPVQHALLGDFVTGETGAWGFSAMGVGLNAQFYRAATPGVPFQVAMQRGVRMYHDQTTRPLHDLRWELMTLLAHGAFVTMIDKTGFDGSLDSLAYERIEAALTEAHDKRDHFGHAAVQDVGIYFSSRTRDWMGRHEPARYFQSVQGAHQACVMEHITFGVILDENVTAEALRQFKIVLLPNVAIVSDREVELFESYVRAGGKLIITGHTGQLDARGTPRARNSLRELIGADSIAPLDSLDNWVSLPNPDTLHDLADAAQNIRGELLADWPFLVKGPATRYQTTTAKPVGGLYKPFRTLRQQRGEEGTEWPMSAEQVVGPAILLHDVDQGRVLTIAASPDSATASEHAIVEARKLLANCIRLLNPTPRVRITAPSHVEAVVTDDAQNRVLRIHLLGYQPTPRTTPASNRPYVVPGLIEAEPMYRVRVALADTVHHVSSLDNRTMIRTVDGSIEAVVENIHEVLVIRYSE
jgi:hypothetical protein